VSVKDGITAEMVKTMARDPIVFAMANPDPEVLPEEVLKLRPDAIMATGRSDYPNQVNNVLGFPFIFRGALDVMATQINEEMKMAAVRALADLAKSDVPESVSRAYGGLQFRFGRDYLIPKPFDRRALLWVAPAVAQAAMDSGVARKKIDIHQYRDRLEMMLGQSYTIMRGVKKRVQKNSAEAPVRIVLPEGENPKILRAAQLMREEGIAEPILLGNEDRVEKMILDLGLTAGLKGVRITRPSMAEEYERYAKRFSEIRGRKGVNLQRARTLLKQPNYFGSMMVENGDADALLSGVSQSYPDTIRPAIQTIGVQPGSRLAGIYMMILKKRVVWFADTTVNIDPNAEELAGIAIQTARFAQSFMIAEPRVAMLSFSNFGSSPHPLSDKVKRATEIVKERAPELVVDGEMQADTALVPELSQENFPFNLVPGNANVLIFPDLQSGNIAYKLLSKLGGADSIGPILVGMKKPVFVLQKNSDVSDIVNMAAIAAMEVHQRLEKK
jgi:malate dehydrogenase (oxaloacetate-decarboxylating)(NADP+)